MAVISFTFSGRQAHVIDDKGRLILPSQFRDVLNGSKVSGQVYLGCYPGTRFVSVYPFERWEELVLSWKDERRFPSAAVMQEGQRLFFANLEQANVDRTGRITIPSHFRERAGLKSEVTVIGVGEKMEIWSPEELEAHEAEAVKLWDRNALEEPGRLAVGDQDDLRLPRY
jgi:MraZ protein